MKNKNLSSKWLALYITIAGLFLSAILYFTLPSILNYPANTIDNDFQIRMVGIKYTNQFLILVTILAVLIYTSFAIVCGKMSLRNIDKKKDKSRLYRNIKKKMF